MRKEELVAQIRQKGSFLCIGLDTDPDKIPVHLLQEEDPVFEFNKQIIDATHEYCVAFKPNTAFYEALGAKGWSSLEKTAAYLRRHYPAHFSIADAKRGDIGNTSSMYAKAFLQNMDFDSMTVAPYMGEDSVKPFLSLKDKWVILLALTSNTGARDFQTLNTGNHALYAEVLTRSSHWGNSGNMMYVTGATQASEFEAIRKLVPDHFLLVPGVGAQGGSLQTVIKKGMNKDGGLLINASRSIIYASQEKDFAQAASSEARRLRDEMSSFL